MPRRGWVRILVAFWVMVSAAVCVAAPGPTVQKVRFHQSPDKIRIVLDMTEVPAFTAVMEQEPHRLLIEMPAVLAKTVPPRTVFNDPAVGSLQMEETDAGRIRIAVNLNQTVKYNIFRLGSPHRLVIDFQKAFDQKLERDIRPGLKYTSWLRSFPHGPVQAHILAIDRRAGYIIKPVLSNGAVQGLEPLGSMSAGAGAVAAINGSYFTPSGEIIGLLKISGEIISTPNIPRTAIGFFPDGRIAFDQAGWQGYVELDGSRVGLSGVNRERGEDELILYTGRYGSSTRTNAYGLELVIGPDSRVLSIAKGNTKLDAAAVVLSAHGALARELAGLRPGDSVKIHQSLGPVWDEAEHALGAGPRLVKDGAVYLTTKTEEFGSDVAGGRAPRSAVGLTANTVLLVVVDGRQAASAGLTLLELALFMQELGAVEAMNLDGGGSSELVIGDKVVNRPSDGRERKIGDALAVIPAKLAN